MTSIGTNSVSEAEAKWFLTQLKTSSIDFIYIDPPFFTQKSHIYSRGNNTGKIAFEDTWDSIIDYVYWLTEVCHLCISVLKPNGIFILHLAHHSVHYMKVELDKIFGINRFVNELIWHYTGGGRSKRYLSRKHDTLLIYAKGDDYFFNTESLRVPYKPTSGYARSGIRAKSGKRYFPNPTGTLLDDVWDIPIVNPMATERNGYPTQKPLELLSRLIAAFCPEQGIVADPMCGSGTTLVAASRLNRLWIGADVNPEAVKLSVSRLPKGSD